MHLFEHIRYHKVGVTKNNLVSIILQSTKNSKTFSFLNVLETPPILFGDQNKNTD